MSQELKFGLGDKVVIANAGKVYSSYETMAQLMNLTKWHKHSDTHNGAEGTVVSISKHPHAGVVLLGILSRGREYVVAQDGVESFSLTRTRELEAQRAELKARIDVIESELKELN